VEIKKSAIFQTRNRLGLQDVTLCHSGGSGNAGVIESQHQVKIANQGTDDKMQWHWTMSKMAN